MGKKRVPPAKRRKPRPKTLPDEMMLEGGSMGVGTMMVPEGRRKKKVKKTRR